jgi:hypothetical protein
MRTADVTAPDVTSGQCAQGRCPCSCSCPCPCSCQHMSTHTHTHTWDPTYLHRNRSVVGHRAPANNKPDSILCSGGRRTCQTSCSASRPILAHKSAVICKRRCLCAKSRPLSQKRAGGSYESCQPMLLTMPTSGIRGERWVGVIGVPFSCGVSRPPLYKNAIVNTIAATR